MKWELVNIENYHRICYTNTILTLFNGHEARCKKDITEKNMLRWLKFGGQVVLALYD